MKKNLIYCLVALCIISCEKDADVPMLQFTVTEEVETSYYCEADFEISWISNASLRTVCFIYSTNADLTNAKSVPLGDGTSGKTIITLYGLEPGVEHFYRYHIVGSHNNEIDAGVLKSFRTKAIELPQVSIEEAQEVSYTTAKVGVLLGKWGGPNRPNWGICYSTEPNPNIESYKNGKMIYAGDVTGKYEFSLTDLIPGQVYYARGFAGNEAGAAYSEEIQFTTQDYGLPTIKTIVPSSIAYTTANSGCNIIEDGGIEVPECGICYGTKPMPDIEGNKAMWKPTKMGENRVQIRFLKPGTKFYVRAYAVNSKGVAYGEQCEFTTLAAANASSMNYLNDPNIFIIDFLNRIVLYTKEGYWIVVPTANGYMFYRQYDMNEISRITDFFSCTDAEKEQYESMH